MSLSPNAQFNLQATGSNNGLWGVNLNGNFSIADGLFGGRVTVNCAGNSNINVSASQAQNVFQILTGALTGSILYILPATGGFFYITNSTSGAYTLTVVNTALGTGVVIPQGTSQLVFSNPDNTTVYSTLPTALSLSTLALSGQLTSTLSTGTAPLVVASTTKVSNLYVDRAALADTVTTNANLTGGVTSVGNAATVVTNANLTGPITSTGNAVAALTAFNVLLGAGSSAIAYAAPGTAGQVLQSNGAASNPTFQTIPNLPSVTYGNPWKVVLGSLTVQGGYITPSVNPSLTFATAFSDVPATVLVSTQNTVASSYCVIIPAAPTSTGFTTHTFSSTTGNTITVGVNWIAVGPT